MYMNETNASPPVLLSIIVPTRNRTEYAIPSIESLLRMPSSDFQVVVQDNSDDDELETFLNARVRDARVRYNHTTDLLNFADNFARATELATGEYLTYIADNDGVNPEIIDATAWARAEKLDALTPSSLVNYSWPDLHMHRHGSVQAGELRLRPFTGTVTFPDAEAEMLKCVRDAGYNFHKMPKAYYGIVRRECVERVKEKTGTYFPGISPDMAIAMSLANYVKRTCHIDYPLFIPGSAAKSTGGKVGMRQDVGWLRDQPHLPASCEQNWSEIVPAFFSTRTMWAESAVTALLATGRSDILSHFNVPLLYSMCVMAYPAYSWTTMKQFYRALRVTKRNRVTGTAEFVGHVLYQLRRHAPRFAASLLGMLPSVEGHTITGLRDTDEAVQAFSEHLKNTGRRFNDAVALHV